jgi:succinate dehydrogenase / fumarate reductase iron-sulfur subunit
MVEFRVFRYDPDKDGEPKFQSYKFEEPEGMTVLEGLFHILENMDNSLAFRCSCREAVCGSCAMHINGKYRLACKTQIGPLGNVITVRPLAHLPVIKDLVVDMTAFWENFKKIQPYLIPKEPPPEKEYYQSVEDRQKIDDQLDCILCGACYGSCPVASQDDKYLGPHALLKVLRFVNDSRDGAAKDRVMFVASDYGVFRCHTIFNCREVCPKELDPTKAIAKLKMKAIFKNF